MTAITVETIVERTKVVLQETGSEGVRWKNAEFVEWLNEFYQQISSLRPDATSLTVSHPLVEGTRQNIPAGGLRLLDVIRNVAAESNKGVILPMDREILDSQYRGWHNESPSINIEGYIFNDVNPRNFYVYPPASSNAEIELTYSSVPELHVGDYEAVKGEGIKIPESYAPDIVDWILYRSFSKDADNASNLNRANLHLSTLMQKYGIKIRVAAAVSPNNNSANGGMLA